MGDEVLANKVHIQEMEVLLADKVHKQEPQRGAIRFTTCNYPYISSSKSTATYV